MIITVPSLATSAAPLALARSGITVVANIPTHLQGDRGPTGDTSHFEYTQGVPASVWTVTHNLNRHPSVSIVDSAGSLFIADVHYDSLQTRTLSFANPMMGMAYIN